MPSLVSPAEVIARVSSAGDLSTPTLQSLIDANEILLNLRSQALATERTITVAGYPGTVILLPERAGEVTSITEQWLYASTSDVELDETDWRLAAGGTAIERIPDGMHPSDTFAERLVIEYVPFDTTALRKSVLIQLVEADLNFAPGISSQRLGDYSETKTSSQSGQASLMAIKEGLLAQLDPVLPVFA